MTLSIIKNDKNVEIILGILEKTLETRPIKNFDPIVIDFLSTLSDSLIKDVEVKKYPDIITFAYYCRKSNIQRIKDSHQQQNLKFGLGVVFHFTPTNVPINFAYSLIFSLLAGNPNLIRLSNKNYVEYDLVIKHLQSVLEQKKFEKIKSFVCIIRYEHNDVLTGDLLNYCSARMIWGGDIAVNRIKNIRTLDKTKDLVFGDRFSVAVINPKFVLELSNKELMKFIVDFYNDTFIFSQNACSSPKVIFWIGDEESSKKGIEIFWQNLDILVRKKFDLDPIHVFDKFTDLYVLASKTNMKHEKNHNLIYRISIQLDDLKNLDFKNKLGTIFEVEVNNLINFDIFDNKKLQTLTYFGLSHEYLKDFIQNWLPKGIDRIVPVGKALEMTNYWDGYDLISELSRIINFE